MHFIKYKNSKSVLSLRVYNSLIKILILSFLFSSSNYLFAQVHLEDQKKQIKDLQAESYENLEKEFWKSDRMDSITRFRYAEAYLLKAKKRKDTAEIADAYYMMLYASQSNNSQLYTDSIIAITKDNINYNQPAKAYLLRANNYGVNGRYKEAFMALHKADFYAKTSGNTHQLYEIKYLISRLKTDVGDYQSSLDILRDIVLHYKDNSNIRPYIVSSWAYGNTLNLLKKPDSALLINRKIIPLSLKTKDSVMYNKLLLSSAIAYYEKEDYKSSLDSILKLREYNNKKDFGNSINVLMNLYQGKIYLKQQKNELAIKNFEKVDSISTSKNYFHSSIRENYTLMYNYYKQKKDIKNQLYYINKLLVTDSILDSDYAYLLKNINDKYTKPNLIAEKQKIINSLESSGFNKKMGIVFLLSFSCILIIALARNTKKMQLYKKRIEELGTTKKVQTYIIDDNTTKRILDDLSKIEQSELFLNKDFNLAHLSKLLNTNTSYLSQTINKHKKLTFKQYLMDLRINFLIKQLDENPILRKHSIEALAESIGYKNASSFTRIFKNHIGISPSEYFRKRYKT